MPGIKINFGEVESSFEPIPEGRYDCIVEVVEVRESKSSDNDYLNWELKVTDGEFADRRLWMITSLSEKALFRLKDTYLALEVIEEDEEIDLEWEEDVDITPQEGPRVTNPDVEGLACVAVVTNEMYDGRERNRVNEIVAAGSSTGPSTKSSGRPAKRQSRASSSNGAKAKASSSSSKAKTAAKKSTPKAAAAKSSGSSRSRASSSGGRQRKLR